jgi:hypothetical protein
MRPETAGAEAASRLSSSLRVRSSGCQNPSLPRFPSAARSRGTARYHRAPRRSTSGTRQGVIHGGVHILDTGVGVEQWSAGRNEMLASGEQHLARGRRLQSHSHGPGQDSPREVVDDRMDMRPRPVEEFDDGGVDMPSDVRLGGAYAVTPVHTNQPRRPPSWTEPQDVVHEPWDYLSFLRFPALRTTAA